MRSGTTSNFQINLNLIIFVEYICIVRVKIVKKFARTMHVPYVLCFLKIKSLSFYLYINKIISTIREYGKNTTSILPEGHKMSPRETK